ncbi:MAG TPA: hypothetical protein VFC45_09025 [Pseudolabrys sp.]|nr:hypothetical protein [Pseudolabrys sp.]
MKIKFRHTAVLIAAATILPASGASAQWFSSNPNSSPPPLYPYVAPAQRASAVKVALPTHVIHRPSEKQSEPRRQTHVQKQASTPPVRMRKQKHRKIDPALIEELRKRSRIKRAIVNTTRIVEEKPVIKSEGSGGAHIIYRGGKDEARVISADAEVTILGPDRMSIQLFRKGSRPKAEAQPEEE